MSLLPDGGCIAQGVTVVDETGQQIEVRSSGTEYSFIMPDCSVTVQAQFIRVLPFLDVYADQWYWDQICYIYENKIMVGTSETLFQPDMTTTRGMVATTLYHMAGSLKPAKTPSLTMSRRNTTTLFRSSGPMKIRSRRDTEAVNLAPMTALHGNSWL